MLHQKPHRFVVLVCGGREYDNHKEMYRTLDDLRVDKGITELVHGAARGADRMAGVYAMNRKIFVTPYPAEWRKYGNAAGAIRNGVMLQKSKPDLVVAFRGGRGTADMVRKAEAAGVPVKKVNWDGQTATPEISSARQTAPQYGDVYFGHNSAHRRPAGGQ